MTENEIVEEIDNLIIWINARRNAPLILSDFGADIAVKALNEWKEYKALGTVEELREAMEKQRAKKPIKQKEEPTDEQAEELVELGFYSGDILRCPCCGEYIAIKDLKHCMNCGQAIDWSEEE